MKVRTILLWMAVGSACTLAVMSIRQHKVLSHLPESASASVPATNLQKVIVASPGRVEGSSEPVEVGTAVDGIVQDVLVKEGKVVERGRVMARLASSDVDAELRQAVAELRVSEQRGLRLLAGRRPEERELAAQKVETATAILEEASRYYGRMQALAARDDISQAALDKARRDFEVAQSQVQEAIRNQHMIDAPPLKEDVTLAEAEVDAAAQHLHVLEEKLAKYAIRAPITGTVTRSYAKPGESFSATSPRPLFTISDIGSRRVRAQVDERDVASLGVGQNVEVTADAFASQTFRGNVIQIYPALGRKTVMTGDPADKSDRDILEVLVRLPPEAKVLPLGLRVAVQFLETPLGNGKVNARETRNPVLRAPTPGSR
jgi:multidrug resistance efflux pump